MHFKCWGDINNIFALQSSSNAHLWELVHEAYGSDLGLTDDDDDYWYGLEFRAGTSPKN